MVARNEAERCRAAVAEPCTFRLFFAVGVIIGVTVGVTFLVQIIPLTILLRFEKSGFLKRKHPFNYHLTQRAKSGANPLFIGVLERLTGV